MFPTPQTVAYHTLAWIGSFVYYSVLVFLAVFIIYQCIMIHKENKLMKEEDN